MSRDELDPEIPVWNFFSERYETPSETDHMMRRARGWPQRYPWRRYFDRQTRTWREFEEN